MDNRLSHTQGVVRSLRAHRCAGHHAVESSSISFLDAVFLENGRLGIFEEENCIAANERKMSGDSWG